MNENKFLDAVTNIDGELVERFIRYDENVEKLSKRKRIIGWGSLAACLALILSVAFTLPMFFKDGGSDSGKGPNKYVVLGESSARIWQWEYMTVFERYVEISFDGKKYSGRGREISEELIGKMLGVGKASGYDVYTKKTYSEDFEVYRIYGVSEKYLVAAKMEGKYYVFDDHEEKAPKTLGEVWGRYSLSESIALSRFSSVKNGKHDAYFRLKDDGTVWDILDECRLAEAVTVDSFFALQRDYISFTVTSEPLGVYKHALYITEDGYLWTNAFDYAYCYFIGTDAASRIIGYAMSNSTEAEYEPYEYTLAGRITEIGEGYFILDDTPVCVNEKDGKQYKILTDDIRIRRCIEVGGIGVGAIVIVRYELTYTEGNEIRGAYGMSRGYISSGDVLIPE